MDFFARQEAARAQSRWLIGWFALAVIVVDLAVTVVLALLLAGGLDRQAALADPARWLATNAPLLALCALGVLAIILGGAAAKSLQLQGGGSVVARLMGADLVDRNTTDPAKKRLLNVVEEMALASGVPVPAVYVMEGEGGINAFAAGHTAADSVVTVTRGALERFDRAELQGVVGHEFSHILNGDMRLNLRLIGLVAGLFAIATVGRLLLRGGSRSRKGGGIALAGLAIVVLGYVGVMLGRMIQAAISRQREFLADASAVQFTRDPQGLRDALVLVGASGEGSRIHADEAHEIAHMFFASGLSGLFATHPPLADRIRALDPSFRPEEFERVAERLQARAPASAAAPAHAVAGAGADFVDAATRIVLGSAAVAASVGNPRAPHVRHAALLRDAMPAGLAADAADPATARALLVALVGAATGTSRERRTEALASAFGADVAAAAAQRSDLDTLAEDQRLPLLLQLIPALGRLPLADRQALIAGIDQMMRADGTITLPEYALARLARVHLGEQAAPRTGASQATLLQLEADLQVLFSTLAQCGHAREEDARNAYERGLTRALPGRRAPYQPLADWVPAMDAALDRLDRLRPADKQRLIDALAIIVAHDGALELGEAEMLRAVCGSLHCPLPPFIDLDEATARAEE